MAVSHNKGQLRVGEVSSKIAKIYGVHAGVPSSGAVLCWAININEFKQFLP